MKKISKKKILKLLKSKWMMAVYAVIVVIIAIVVGISVYVNSVLDKMYNPNINIVQRDEAYTPDTTLPDDIIPADDTDVGEYIPGEDEEIIIETPSYTPESAPTPIDRYNDFVIYDRYYEPAGSNSPIYYKEQINPDVFNFILLARDTRDAYRDRGRTDSMMLVSYNKKTREIKLISLQRDMLVPIEGRSDWNKLNTAYIYGGVGLCINTVNDLFGLDIQRYVTVVISSVAPLIDKIGGIRLYVTEDEAAYYKTHEADVMGTLEKGWNDMTGEQVTIFVRNRAVGNADASRTRRQRDAIEAIYKKIIGEFSLPEILELIEYAAPLVATNFTNDEIISLAQDVILGGDITIDDHRIPEEGLYDSVWYRTMLVLSVDFEANTQKLHEYIYGKSEEEEIAE